MPSPRNAVLNAALTIFDTRGFAGTTAQVATAAAVGVGTVYRHFGTKQGLLAALFAEVERSLEDECGPAQPRPTRTALREFGPCADAFAAWHVAAHRALEYPAAFRYWVRYRAGMPGAAARARERPGWLARVAQALAAAEATGGKRHHPARHALAVALFAGSWEATIHFLLAREAANGPDPAGRFDVLETAFASWWQGLQW